MPVRLSACLYLFHELILCCKHCRDETEQTGNSTLVYGEITFKTLALALHKVKTKYGLPGVGSSGPAGVLQGAGGTFYDIGSGTGKPVWVKCMGVKRPQIRVFFLRGVMLR